MKIKILAKKLSLSGIDKSLCSIVNMLSVNHEVTLVQTYKEENGTHKLNDNVKQVFLLSSEKEEKRSIVKKLLLKIKVGFLNKSVIKKEIKKNDYDVLITSNSTYVKWFKYNKMNKYKVVIITHQILIFLLSNPVAVVVHQMNMKMGHMMKYQILMVNMMVIK